MSSDLAAALRRRLRVEIHGAVQGVGFRPFVYRLAAELGLAGWVINDTRGVFVEVEGPEGALAEFLQRLVAERPPRAIVQSVESAWLDPAGYEWFEIRHSDGQGSKTVLVLPDIAVCPDCLAEVLDPADRRHRYPFTNCTNCGPRFSIIRALPYDRPNTTMRQFVMCPRCQAEYENPLDRRFHAQPNACPVCGPRLALYMPRGKGQGAGRWGQGAERTEAPAAPDWEMAAQEDEALRLAADALRRGQIVAVKGLGGFHLMVDAGNAAAIRWLRERKPRRDKPFALMVRDLDQARALCDVDEPAAALLASPEAPIVLLPRRPSAPVADEVAPGSPTLGVMLAYTPLHHLLLQEVAREAARSETGHSEQRMPRSETGHSEQQMPRSDTGHSEQQMPRSDTGHSEQQMPRSETGHNEQQAARSETGHSEQQMPRSETGHSEQQMPRSETGHSEQQTPRSETGHSEQQAARSETGPSGQWETGPGVAALVATSGNLSDEPICTDEHEAMQRLGHIADLFLVHDRPIERHVDDSLAWMVEGQPRLLRRARGYAPLPVRLSEPAPTILAVGAHQKNTVALSVGRQVFISQHIGDLETAQAMAAFERVIADFLRLYEIQPVAIAHDLHPDYLSTRWAREQKEGRRKEEGGDSSSPFLLPPSSLIPVQHHHAHLAACLAENGVDGPVLGVTWDGTGYGTDGTIWGGEFLLGDAGGFTRAAHLRPFRLPGGDAAIKEPRRTALAILWELFGDQVLDWDFLAPVRSLPASDRQVLAQMLRRGFNAPITTSAGRLFDGVAALLGLHQQVSFEGQAAMALEYAVDSMTVDAYPFALAPQAVSADSSFSVQQSALILDWRPLVEAILDDLQRGVSSGIMAARFHNALIDGIVAVADAVGAPRVALTGGCFQNRLLLERSAQRLRKTGFEVLLHHQVPPNDGGISLGQIAVAARAREQ